MKLISAITVFVALQFGLVTGHDGHDHGDQMPLDYVKYPLEPLYRGLNGEGVTYHLVCRFFLTGFFSYRRLYLLWYYYVCQASMGSVSLQRPKRSF